MVVQVDDTTLPGVVLFTLLQHCASQNQDISVSQNFVSSKLILTNYLQNLQKCSQNSEYIYWVCGVLTPLFIARQDCQLLFQLMINESVLVGSKLIFYTGCSELKMHSQNGMFQSSSTCSNLVKDN